MKSAGLAKVPPKNRLFDLDIELQMIIYRYSDILFKDVLITTDFESFRYKNTVYLTATDNIDKARRTRFVFEEVRKEELSYDKLYFVGLYSGIVNTLSTRERLYCRTCQIRLPVAHIRTPGPDLNSYYAQCPWTVDANGRKTSPCREKYESPELNNVYLARAALNRIRRNRIGDYKDGIYSIVIDEEGNARSVFVSHDREEPDDVEA